VLISVLAGFAASAVLIIAIGAQNAFVLRQGLRREHVLPGWAARGAVIPARPEAVTAIRWVGAFFLLGYAALAAKRALRPGALTTVDRPPATLRATLLTCLALTYLNPHVYLDTVLLLGSVAQQHPHRWLFGAGAAAASAVWFTGLGAGAHRLAPVLARPAAWRVLDGLIAVVMAGIATALLV
jgi:L-lysine exporter family protein LysE/ArgO